MNARLPFSGQLPWLAPYTAFWDRAAATATPPAPGLDRHWEAWHRLADLGLRHLQQVGQSALRESEPAAGRWQELMQDLWREGTASPWHWGPLWWDYLQDSTQRQVLLADTLRRRGNDFLDHEAAGMPPVLDFEYETLIDGRQLPRPVNYALLRIVPPAGRVTDPARRPFMIVDPRAGHGAGIGGFKADSQVGEAFENGHTVYFVVFHPLPEPDQTLADVRDAEVHFLEEIARRHPDAPLPAVVGNCQGGWATMLLAASAPDKVGPVVINGAPMSYWAGKVGHNPMRYMGGLGGGAVPAMLAADLGKGLFDGSALVANFENLNPANTYLRKTYKLYSEIDTEAERFLEFERWWGGFFLMTEPEIRWIIENLFVGNRLARGEAFLGGERIDLRRIRTPIIVFASQGDNITPPQQALNWIADLYADVDEIKVRGQRIVYLVHESVGHLGIFVSSQVAGREHDAITDTLDAIDALAPGLYEMKLDDGEDRTHIRFEPRSIDDILALDDGRDDEEMFASVARLSELGAEIYELAIRPLVQAAVTAPAAEALRQMQPQRTRRAAWADRNPTMRSVGALAEQVRTHRKPVDPDNPFVRMERMLAETMGAQLDLYRDTRDAWQEIFFHAIYGTPAVKGIGQRILEEHARRRTQDVHQLPEVRSALAATAEGGVLEATARMVLLLARARGYERRTRLERLLSTLRHLAPEASHDENSLQALVQRQSLIVHFAPEEALAALPILLPTDDDRRQALAGALEIAGPRETMHPSAHLLYQRMMDLLAVDTTRPPAPRLREVA